MTVAVGAVQIGPHVHCVREIYEVRQTLQPHPRDRVLAMPLPRHGLGFGAFFDEIGMATHAQLDGRNACRRGNGGKTMAVQTIHFQLPRMSCMAEWDRLPILALRIQTARGIQDTHPSRYRTGKKQHGYAAHNRAVSCHGKRTCKEQTFSIRL
jgi:hypothetical protein